MTDIWADRSFRIWLIVCLAAVAVGMQVALFSRQSLWPDEIFSLAMATGHSLEHPANKAEMSAGDFVLSDHARPAREWRGYIEHDTPAAGPRRVVRAVFLSDTSPPLYYFLLYGWTRVLGAHDWSLRAFSVLWALACIPLISRLAARFGPPSMTVIAPALFVFSPPACYYFAEGRMYSMVWFVTLATAGLTLWLRERGGVWRQSLWVVLAAAGLLTHYFFLFPLAAMILFQFVTPGIDRRWMVVARVAVVGALILPWYQHLPENMHAWRITMDWINLRPGGFSRIGAARDLLLQFFSGRTLSLWTTPRAVELVTVGLIAAAAIVTGLKIRWQLIRGPRLLLWLWLSAAWLGPVVIDALKGTYTSGISRYALAGLPAAMLLIAGAVAGLGRRWRLAVLTLIVASWSISLLSIYRWRWRSGAPTREVARDVGSNPQPGDLILVHSIPSAVIGLAYYMDPAAEVAAWTEQLGTQRVPETLQRLIAGRSRIRFVRTHELGEPAPEEAWLREHATVVKESRRGRTVMIDFRPNEGPTF